MLIIGFSGPRNPETRNVVHQFVNHFGTVAHYSMIEPAIAGTAAILGMTYAGLYQHTLGSTRIEGTNNNINDLLRTIKHDLRILNRDFFIDRAQAKLNGLNKNFYTPIFTGLFISDITTEREAQWIRNQGGEIVHILNDQCFSDDFVPLTIHPNEVVIESSRSNPVKSELIKIALKHLDNKHVQKAA
jgi:hypothetical protein